MFYFIHSPTHIGPTLGVFYQLSPLSLHIRFLYFVFHSDCSFYSLVPSVCLSLTYLSMLFHAHFTFHLTLVRSHLRGPSSAFTFFWGFFCFFFKIVHSTFFFHSFSPSPIHDGLLLYMPFSFSCHFFTFFHMFSGTFVFSINSHFFLLCVVQHSSLLSSFTDLFSVSHHHCFPFFVLLHSLSPSFTYLGIFLHYFHIAYTFHHPFT